ncbi:MAG: hypothetical protein D4R93_03380 [Deltaproteobacteria bacterium]|nr:MAG: hypothetical protein D4R93_03380 [Deltaproteobacteria bacterium]
MARCTRTTQLEVHHIRRTGDATLDNARVLCFECHKATSSFGTPGTSPPDFSEDIKAKALKNAGNQCECTSTGGCH